MSPLLLLLVVLLIILLAGGGYGYRSWGGWGSSYPYYGAGVGVLGVVLIGLLVILLFGRL